MAKCFYNKRDKREDLLSKMQAFKPTPKLGFLRQKWHFCTNTQLQMNRRTFYRYTSLAALGLGLAACRTSRGEKDPETVSRIKPRRLKRGDTVGLITPGSYIEDEDLERAVNQIENLGLRVALGKHIRAYRGYLAGTDEQRLEDLHRAFSDRRLAGVWCARGGYGVTRLLPKIDYALIRQNPKVLIGYSDITALLQAVYLRTGLVCFHGPVGASEFTDYTRRHLVAQVMEGRAPWTIAKRDYEDERKEQSAYQSEMIRPGRARGVLMGGNLSLLSAMAGTPFDVPAKDHLIFIEDVGEKPYRIDRMLTQLRQSGALDQAAGVVLGVFADCEADPDAHSLRLIETLRDRLGDLNCPVYYGLPFGHIDDQCTLPVGVEASFDADSGALTVLEAGVR